MLGVWFVLAKCLNFTDVFSAISVIMVCLCYNERKSKFTLNQINDKSRVEVNDLL